MPAHKHSTWVRRLRVRDILPACMVRATLTNSRLWFLRDRPFCVHIVGDVLMTVPLACRFDAPGDFWLLPAFEYEHVRSAPTALPHRQRQRKHIML